MKPFGQWLNDFKPKQIDPQPEACDGPVIAPRPEGQTIVSPYYDPPVTKLAHCYKCGVSVDPARYGVDPDVIADDDMFMCDDCWTDSMDGDIGMDGDADWLQPHWENEDGDS